MPHWKSMTERKYIFAFDLDGKDVNACIERVEGGSLRTKDGGTEKKPFVFFRGVPKPLALNTVNAKAIASICGSPNTDEWIGKWVTLYPTTTSLAGETVDCIRIRPRAPKLPAASAPTEPAPPAEVPS